MQSSKSRFARMRQKLLEIQPASQTPANQPREEKPPGAHAKPDGRCDVVSPGRSVSEQR